MNALQNNETTDIEKILKEKWRRNFKEEIIEHKEKNEREKMKKIIEEKSYLEKINKEIKDEEMKNKYKKLKDTNERLQEYQIYLDSKKQTQLSKLRERE